MAISGYHHPGALIAPPLVRRQRRREPVDLGPLPLPRVPLALDPALVVPLPHLIHPDERRVGTCIGSAGPTPIVASEAEAFAAGALDWDGGSLPEDATLARFGELVAQAASPIDDVRGSAAYRRHALGVLARRELAWAWSEL